MRHKLGWTWSGKVLGWKGCHRPSTGGKKGQAQGSQGGCHSTHGEAHTRECQALQVHQQLPAKD
eukprot:2169561-Prorocentrum_lima.AAC.1